jgi:hypothetical protein
MTMKRLPFFLAAVTAFVVAALTQPALAMYHPTVGRFLQRDPIGYADGVHLTQYVAGRPLILIDPIGLWSKIVRDNEKEWAEVCSNETTDTWETLAPLAQMDPSEWQKWVRTNEGELPPSVPILGSWYRVPNTIVVSKHTKYWRGENDTVQREFELIQEGYYVDYVINVDEEYKYSLEDHFPYRPQVFGFLYMGHGAAEIRSVTVFAPIEGYPASFTISSEMYTGEIEDPYPKNPKKPWLKASDIQPVHKLGLVEIWACGSAFGDWEKLVSPTGTWRLYTGPHSMKPLVGNLGGEDWNKVTGVGPDSKPIYRPEKAKVPGVIEMLISTIW